MATFADDEDIDFEELWGSGGGGVDVNNKIIKVEGRQRSPAYVAQVTAVMRAALDRCMEDPQSYQPENRWMNELGSVSEGSQTTLGAYHRPWQ